MGNKNDVGNTTNAGAANTDPEVVEMLNRIAGGEAPGNVLDSVFPVAVPEERTAKVRGGRSICIECNTDCPPGENTCPSCGQATAQVKGSIEIVSESDVPEMVESTNPAYILPKPPPPAGEREYALADLRPPDRFLFTKTVPDTRCDLTTEYQVVPAHRGAVSFSAQMKDVTFSLALKSAHLYPVNLMSPDNIDPAHRFHPGDQVEHRHEEWTGTVHQHHDEGYYVQPTSEEGEDDGKGIIWVRQVDLKLVNKQETTQGYITRVGNRFRVQWATANESSTEDRLVDALRILFTRNRTAFNRYSRFMSEDEDLRKAVDPASQKYLSRVDKAYWGVAE